MFKSVAVADTVSCQISGVGIGEVEKLTERIPGRELLSNRLIEIPHQRGLLHKAKVAPHEFSKLLAEQCHCLSVAAHICKSDRRDDATGAH